QGVSVVHLYGEHLKKIKVAYPSIEEQTKIAELLSLIDRRISTQNKIIEDLKKLKVAITDWLIESISDSSEIKYLENIADIYQPQTIPTSALNDDAEYLVYGANGIIGKYHKYNHEYSQICITCRGNTCGNINFSVPKSWITGNAMVVNIDEYTHIVNKRYLYHYLSTINFTPLISGSGQPQIVRQPLAKLKIPTPSLEQQDKIVNIIDNFEQKIEIENKYLQSLLAQKSYLLSNMFI
ncbi:MAG: restriction endonuclease subunit S, partial [Clostridia bacterium]|nr:restriction endonuclease subunit S [Clostridia bacterium]